MATNTQTWRDIAKAENVRGLCDFNSLVTDALQTQYSHATRFKALCSVLQSNISATEDLENLLIDVISPETAQGVFLDWWGDRVGVSRNIELNGVDTRLDDDLFRFLIFYKALANISDSSIATMNNLLTLLLGLPVFVIDNLDMTISVRILGSPTDLQIEILKNYGLLTRGAGVGYNIIIQNPETAIFGFKGSGLMPFNNGVFNPTQEIGIAEQLS